MLLSRTLGRFSLRDNLKRMREHGISVVRIAEFAWNKFEPREGEFNIGWFDPFMKIAERIWVIFCTPTATPPAWLTEKYPEVLNADDAGNPYRHGMRRHYNYTSGKYWELSRRLIHKLAVHYCSYSNVIGWQLDNEINCEMADFHAESDHKAFRNYMKAKYETLDNLNDKWERPSGIKRIQIGKKFICVVILSVGLIILIWNWRGSGLSLMPRIPF